jgi:hypothetical protein
VIPIRKLKNPIQAERRGKRGLPSRASILAPILWRNEINVNVIKNITEHEMAIAMKTGVKAVGAESRRFGAPLGRTERLYSGEIVAVVQLMLAALFVREHDPSTPRNTLGPSIPFDEPVSESAVDGTTANRDI